MRETTPLPGGGGGGGCGSQSTFLAARPVAAPLSPGQGTLREEGQRQGAHPPESLLCDWGVAGGLVPQRGARAEGATRGEPGPPARRAAPLPPSAPPGAGARVPGGRGGAGKPRPGRSQLIGRRSRGSRWLLAEGTARRGPPAAGASPGLGLRPLTAGPGEAGAPRARRRGVVRPAPDASGPRSPKPEEEVGSSHRFLCFPGRPDPLWILA